METIIIIIAVSFLIYVSCYVYVSRREKNYLNILFPAMITAVPINYVFEPLYLYYNGPFGSVYSYFYIYLCTTGIMLATSLAYVYTPSNLLVRLPFSNVKAKSKLISYILLGLAFIVYFPVLVEFRAFIFQPREIYIRTRTGYGFSFFVSTLLAMLGYITFLFSRNISIKSIILITLLVAAFLYLHGSKGQILTLIIILALYYTYVRDWKVNMKKIAIIISATAALVISLFVLTATFEYDNIFKLMTGYSDYNRNAMLIIDKDDSNYGGQLTYESNIYSRVPRAIMPDKPKDFGVFKLAKKYFPEWYYADTGSPAFGVGVQYADFGNYAVFYLVFWGAVTGFLLKIFRNRLRIYKMPGDFIVILFLCGINLLPLGEGYLLPEQLIIAMLINMAFALKLKS